MIKLIRMVLVSCCLFACITPALVADDLGVIEGRVVDHSGRAVAGAKVNVDAMDGKIRASFVHYEVTDKNGSFKFDHLKMMEYKIFAMKEEEGFPDLSFAFYSNNVVTKVVLTPKAPKAKVVLKISKGGRISGSLTSRSTKEGVAATFELKRVAPPQLWITTAFQSSFSVLVPADAEIILKVSAHGFEDWYYPGTNDPNRAVPIKMKSAEDKQFDIALQEKH